MPNFEPRHLKRAVIKEEYIVITGDMMESVILNQLIYWSEKVRDFDQFIFENVKQTRENDTAESLLLHGWIYKSADQLKDEIMSQDSTRTINRKLESLVTKKFLLRRRNPKDRYDHKYQYRVNFIAVMVALDEAGYALEGYAKFFPAQAQMSSSEDSVNELADLPSRQIVKTKGQIGGSGRQIGATKRQIDASERHGVATIAETITKITTETTPEISSPSCPPTSGLETETMTEDESGELDSFFTGIGFEQLRHQEAVQRLKALMTDLWHTRRIGKEQISPKTIREAFGALTPQTLDSLLDRVYRQRQKGDIPLPELYVQRAILNAAQSAGFDKMARQGSGGEAHAPTYDMQDYIDFSMQRLLDGSN
ncbi:hypothetical protein [Ethanoligenens sp.]|uniref:hypothetical protein n=1 Tax=Ethanoligenens sp. TaxID=2099655 RepID=UPI0039E911CD